MHKFKQGDSVVYVSDHQATATDKIGKICKVLPSGTRYYVHIAGRCWLMFETSLKKSPTPSTGNCAGCG